MTLPNPTETAEVPRWQLAGCLVGSDRDGCGRPIYGAFAVRTYRDAQHLDEPLPGVLLVCRGHFDALALADTPREGELTEPGQPLDPTGGAGC